MLVPVFESIISYAPAAALMLAALVLEQRREATNGTQPERNVVLRVLAGGMIASGTWLALAFTMDVVDGGNFRHWSAYAPWMFAVGEGVALAWRPSAAPAKRSDI